MSNRIALSYGSMVFVFLLLLSATGRLYASEQSCEQNLRAQLFRCEPDSSIESLVNVLFNTLTDKTSEMFDSPAVNSLSINFMDDWGAIRNDFIQSIQQTAVDFDAQNIPFENFEHSVRIFFTVAATRTTFIQSLSRRLAPRGLLLRVIPESEHPSFGRTLASTWLEAVNDESDSWLNRNRLYLLYFRPVDDSLPAPDSSVIRLREENALLPSYMTGERFSPTIKDNNLPVPEERTWSTSGSAYVCVRVTQTAGKNRIYPIFGSLGGSEVFLTDDLGFAPDVNAFPQAISPSGTAVLGEARCGIRRLKWIWTKDDNRFFSFGTYELSPYNQTFISDDGSIVSGMLVASDGWEHPFLITGNRLLLLDQTLVKDKQYKVMKIEGMDGDGNVFALLFPDFVVTQLRSIDIKFYCSSHE